MRRRSKDVKGPAAFQRAKKRKPDLNRKNVRADRAKQKASAAERKRIGAAKESFIADMGRPSGAFRLCKKHPGALSIRRNGVWICPICRTDKLIAEDKAKKLAASRKKGTRRRQGASAVVAGIQERRRQRKPKATETTREGMLGRRVRRTRFEDVDSKQREEGVILEFTELPSPLPRPNIPEPFLIPPGPRAVVRAPVPKPNAALS